MRRRTTRRSAAARPAGCFSTTSVSFSSCAEAKLGAARPCRAPTRSALWLLRPLSRHALRRMPIHQLDAFDRQRDLGSTRPGSWLSITTRPKKVSLVLTKARQAGAQLLRRLLGRDAGFLSARTSRASAATAMMRNPRQVVGQRQLKQALPASLVKRGRAGRGQNSLRTAGAETAASRRGPAARSSRQPYRQPSCPRSRRALHCQSLLGRALARLRLSSGKEAL